MSGSIGMSPSRPVDFCARRTASMPLLRPTKISHALGSRGGPLERQVSSALRLAFWNASSAACDVAEVPDQRGHHLRTGGGEGGVDPGEIGHNTPGRKIWSGRSSNAPAEPLAAASSFAVAIA